MSVRLTFNRLQGGRIPPSTVLPSFFSHLSPIGFLFSPPHRTKSGFQYDFLSFSPKKKKSFFIDSIFSPSPISIYIFIYFFPLTFRFCVYGAALFLVVVSSKFSSRKRVARLEFRRREHFLPSLLSTLYM